MSLFEECKEALSADFTIIDKEEGKVRISRSFLPKLTR